MPILHILPEDTFISINENETILDAMMRNNIPTAHACGGKGRCSTCRIMVLNGIENFSQRTIQEKSIANKFNFPNNVRQACQCKLKGDAKIRRLVIDDEDKLIIKMFIESKQDLTVGIEKDILILFADIRGFTAFSEDLLPYDIIHILNKHFYILDKIITKYGGYVDNYMGDGLMALFDVNNPQESVIKAISASLEMIDTIKYTMSPYLERLWGKSYDMGIGLHYGLVVAGTVGTSLNKKSTVLGDAVNFASRIEANNKNIGSNFLISDDVYKLCSKRINTGRSTTMEIRGKTGKYILHEVLSLRNSEGIKPTK